MTIKTSRNQVACNFLVPAIWSRSNSSGEICHALNTTHCPKMVKVKQPWGNLSCFEHYTLPENGQGQTALLGKFVML